MVRLMMIQQRNCIKHGRLRIPDMGCPFVVIGNIANAHQDGADYGDLLYGKRIV